MFYTEKSVQVEYEKEPGLKQDDVKELLNWVQDSPHLPIITEFQAILFLHSCYYDLEDANITLDNYFTIRTRNFDLFSCLDKATIKQTLEMSFMKIMPTLTPCGHAVLLAKILDPDTSKFNFHNELRVWNMIFALHLHQFGIFNGIIVVYDMEGYSLKRLFKTNIFLVKRILHFIQLALPVRIQGLHFFNPAFGADKMMRMIKPFLKKELYDMFNFHGWGESVFDYVPRSCMPVDYGGDLPTVRDLNRETIENVFDNLDFFLWHQNQKVDESRRRIKINNSSK